MKPGRAGSNAMRRSGSKVKPMKNWCKSLRFLVFRWAPLAGELFFFAIVVVGG